MFIDLLRSRRSIRQFAKKPIEQEKVDILLEAMLRSPSSRNLNPWEFVVISKPETINKLAQAKVHGSGFMKTASLAIAVCADPAKSDVWVEDTSIASLILHLTAADLGLGSCWVQIRLREHSSTFSAEQYVKEVLGLKDSLVVEAIVAIGYAAEEKPGHDHSRLLFDRVSYEKYGQRE
ncbi:MAG: NAD(P)H-dependent dehydrogenase/reductase [Desulfobacterales bacterium]|nr:NAD(P)H-dependent dehydrogenase/reductase [Desulfobacterales bacterium]